MFCKSCGSELEDAAQFCHNCGHKISNILVEINNPIESKFVGVAEFYSKDWKRNNIFAVSILYFDLMINGRDLYIIQMPKYRGQTFGLVLGFILFNIIGAVIGSLIGDDRDLGKRNQYRSKWIKGGQLVSSEFCKDIFLKIPLDKLKQSIIIGKNRLVLNCSGKSIILKKNKKELRLFYQAIEKYVLL